MKYLFFILVFYSRIQIGFAQDPIYIHASEIGNGIGFERLGESFILTPAHVVDTSVGNIVISDRRKTNSKATLLETYSNDIAILRVEQPKTSYLPLVLPESYASAITNASSGFVAYLDGLGIVNYIHVNITSKDQSSFTVTPIALNDSFKKGMSGSPFYVMHSGVKTLVGMLMSIENGSVDGFIYQWDDILTTIASFTEDTKEKKALKLGVLIQADSAEHLSIIKRITSEVKQVEDYDVVNRIPERHLVDRNLEAILYGTASDAMPNKIKKAVDQLLLGKLSVVYDTNEINMSIVYISFEGGIYSSTDYNLIESISITTKGLGYKKAAAKEQAIKAILTKIKEQLDEN